MVQLTLPRGSKPTTGKVHKAAPGAKDVKTYKVYRYDPEVDADPRWDVYEVPTGDHGPMLLDALIHIKNTIDPTLSFRRSCREGICGSCSMNIDGRNALACTKGWEECSSHNITIAPLPHQPVVKDLVTDLSLFYAQYGPREGAPADPGRAREAGWPVRVHPVRLLLDLLPQLLVEPGRVSGPGGAAAILSLDRRQPRRRDPEAPR